MADALGHGAGPPGRVPAGGGGGRGDKVILLQHGGACSADHWTEQMHA